MMKKHGTVDHVEIFTDHNGRSKGSAVVEYSHAEDAAKAIKELDGSDVQGRKLRLREDQMADDEYAEQLRTMKEKSKAQKEIAMRGPAGPSHMGPPGGGGGPAFGRGGPAPPCGGIGSLLGGGHAQLIQLLNSKGGDPINSSVFVSNLDYELNWQKLKDMMRRAGNCTRCDLAQEEGTNRSKGFGSVQFETPFEALTAIAMFNGMEVGRGNRKMSVRLDRNAALHQVLEQLGVPSNEVTEKTIQQLQSIATLATLTAGTSGLAAAGGLGGLGALSQLTALQSLQSNLQSNPVNSATALSSLAGLSGLGGALGGLQSLLAGSLGSLTSLTGAAQLPTAPPPSSYSGVGGGGYGGSSAGYGGDRRDSVGGGYGGSRDNRSGDFGGRGGGSGGGGGGGREPPAAPGCRVFVRNLPFSLKWQELKDKFRDAGRITRADIRTGEDGRSRGFGTVTFEVPEDANRAVSSFNQMQLDGRTIEVKIDQMNN